MLVAGFYARFRLFAGIDEQGSLICILITSHILVTDVIATVPVLSPSFNLSSSFETNIQYPFPACLPSYTPRVTKTGHENDQKVRIPSPYSALCFLPVPETSLYSCTFRLYTSSNLEKSSV